MIRYIGIPCGIRMYMRDDETPAGAAMHYPHTHDCCELYLFLRGKCTYMVENGIFPLSFGSVLYTRPGELHSVRVTEPCLYERAYIQIKPDVLSFLQPSPLRCFTDRPFGQDNYLQLPPEDAEFCAEGIRRCFQMQEERNPDVQSLSLSVLLEIFSVINRCRESGPPAEGNGLVSDALRCINEFLPEIRTAKDVAQRLYVSREHLSRAFSRDMGITMTRYLTLKRIERAKEYLRRGLSPEEVCSRCGWGDMSYFIAVFRRETGVTPGKYQ